MVSNQYVLRRKLYIHKRGVSVIHESLELRMSFCPQFEEKSFLKIENYVSERNHNLRKHKLNYYICTHFKDRNFIYTMFEDECILIYHFFYWVYLLKFIFDRYVKFSTNDFDHMIIAFYY